MGGLPRLPSDGRVVAAPPRASRPMSGCVHPARRAIVPAHERGHVVAPQLNRIGVPTGRAARVRVISAEIRTHPCELPVGSG